MIRGITFADQLTTSDDFAHLQNKWFNGVSGVTKGCKVTADTNNIYISAGYFLIYGRLVRIVGTETIESDVVETTKYYKLVFEIDLSKTNTVNSFMQGYFKFVSSTSGYPDLIQEDLDTDGKVYQMEFARFIKNTSSITSFEARATSLKVSDIWSKIENEFDAQKADFTQYYDEQTQEVETWFENTKNDIDDEWNNYYTNKQKEIDNTFNSKMDILDAELAKIQKESLVTVAQFGPTVTYSVYKSNRDDNGIYTTVTYKRADGTIYKISELSNLIDGNYTTQTINYFKDDGSTVDKTEVYSITYNADGDVESEVLTNA